MNFIQTFRPNTIGRDFVVSDIHGCWGLFQNKLNLINFDQSKDRMFSVGDLCDRGPDSIKCLQLINEDWFFPVFGNHEWLWCVAHDYFHKLDILPTSNPIDYKIFMHNGGSLIDITTNFSRENLKSFVKLVFELPRAIEIDTGDNQVGIIHAELPFDDWQRLHKLESSSEFEEAEDKLLWGRSMCAFEREPGVDYNIKNIDRVYMGHTVVPDVTHVENRVYIDTGAFFRYGSIKKLEQLKYMKYKPDLTVLEIK